jgi:hypothetical protein
MLSLRARAYLPAHLADRMQIPRAKLHKILKQTNAAVGRPLRDKIFDELGIDHVRAKISVAMLLHDPGPMSSNRSSSQLKASRVSTSR